MHRFTESNNISGDNARVQHSREFGISDFFRTGAEFGDAGKRAKYGRTQNQSNYDGE